MSEDETPGIEYWAQLYDPFCPLLMHLCPGWLFALNPISRPTFNFLQLSKSKIMFPS